MITIKNTNALSYLAEQVGVAAEELAGRVLNDIGRDNLTGREETITPQIAREFTGHLLEEIRSRLNGQQISGVSFKVHCYKRREENIIGADIAGIMTIRNGSRSISKGYLAQAKVAPQASRQGSRVVKIRAGDQNLGRQCNDMLKRSSASFVFVYSKLGVHVVPASTVVFKGQGGVDTATDYYKNFQTFYTEFFKCFIGDLHLGATYDKVAQPDAAFRELGVAHGLAIVADLEQQ